jgi:hypothetical protein
VSKEGRPYSVHYAKETVRFCQYIINLPLLLFKGHPFNIIGKGKKRKRKGRA